MVGFRFLIELEMPATGRAAAEMVNTRLPRPNRHHLCPCTITNNLANFSPQNNTYTHWFCPPACHLPTQFFILFLPFLVLSETCDSNLRPNSYPRSARDVILITRVPWLAPAVLLPQDSLHMELQVLVLRPVRNYCWIISFSLCMISMRFLVIVFTCTLTGRIFLVIMLPKWLFFFFFLCTRTISIDVKLSTIEVAGSNVMAEGVEFWVWHR